VSRRVLFELFFDLAHLVGQMARRHGDGFLEHLDAENEEERTSSPESDDLVYEYLPSTPALRCADAPEHKRDADTPLAPAPK
jgi:hypothetical protein